MFVLCPTRKIILLIYDQSPSAHFTILTSTFFASLGHLLELIKLIVYYMSCTLINDHSRFYNG